MRFTDLALDGSSVPGQSLADLVWPQRPAWRR
jgi:hypothetical protein